MRKRRKRRTKTVRKTSKKGRSCICCFVNSEMEDEEEGIELCICCFGNSEEEEEEAGKELNLMFW